MENPRRQEERDFEIAVQESQEAMTQLSRPAGDLQWSSWRVRAGWVDHGGRCRWPGNALADLWSPPPAQRLFSSSLAKMFCVQSCSKLGWLAECFEKKHIQHEEPWKSSVESSITTIGASFLKFRSVGLLEERWCLCTSPLQASHMDEEVQFWAKTGPWPQELVI
jgi:hypothetical protein